MPTKQSITLFHAPQSRSSGALALLEELHAPYSIHALNMKTGEQRQSPYLAVNPMGKVPAILHGDALITEQVAIGIYLADLSRKRASRQRLAMRCADRICAGTYFTPRVLSRRSSIRR